MGPPSIIRTASAMSTSNGENRISAATEPVTSMKRLRKPEKPRTDLCWLELVGARFRFPFDPLIDELPNFCLEDFTRKCLHLTSDLLYGPRHRFKSADCTDDLIHMLLREKNPIDPILNCFRSAAGAERNYRTATCLSFNRNHSKIFACRH